MLFRAGNRGSNPRRDTKDMITEYKVINATYEEFHKEVAKLLSEGWQPQGGVSVVRSWYALNPTTYYFQAFVR